MTVFRNHAGKVVAAFMHFSDAAEFEEANRSRGLAKRDEPGLEDVIERAAAIPQVDPTWNEAAERSD